MGGGFLGCRRRRGTWIRDEHMGADLQQVETPGMFAAVASTQFTDRLHLSRWLPSPASNQLFTTVPPPFSSICRKLYTLSSARSTRHSGPHHSKRASSGAFLQSISLKEQRRHSGLSEKLQPPPTTRLCFVRTICVTFILLFHFKWNNEPLCFPPAHSGQLEETFSFVILQHRGGTTIIWRTPGGDEINPSFNKSSFPLPCSAVGAAF